MKKLLRTFVFTLLSIVLTNLLFNAFSYSGDALYGFLIIGLGFSIVNYFFPILAGFLSLPSNGFFSILMSIGLNFLMLYLFNIFVPQFAVGTGQTPNLQFFGFVLPSISLTEMWSMVLSSAALAVIYSGFMWLSGSGKEKK